MTTRGQSLDDMQDTPILPDTLQSGAILTANTEIKARVIATSKRDDHDCRLYRLEYLPCRSPDGWYMPGATSTRAWSRDELQGMGWREGKAEPKSMLRGIAEALNVDGIVKH